MEEKANPRVLSLLEETEFLITRLNERLNHVLLPHYPQSSPDGMKLGLAEEPQSTVTSKLRTIVRRLGELNDRVEN